MRRAQPPSFLLVANRRLSSLVALALLLCLLPATAPPAAARTEASDPPRAPALRTPSDGLQTRDTTPTFTWRAGSQSASYRFQLARDSQFLGLVIERDLARRTFTADEPLAPGFAYVWRVGVRDQGGTIAWSEPRWLTILGSDPGSATVDAAGVPPAAEGPEAVSVPAEPRVLTSSLLSGRLAATTGLAVAGAGRSKGSATPAAVVDRDMGTVWFSPSTTPKSAYVDLKLDRTRKIGSIRWVLGRSGYADRMEIQISVDRQTWTTVGRRTNSTAGTWRAIRVDRRARYIRFRFTNPNNDPVLGGLAEIEVMPPSVAAATPAPSQSPTATATPSGTPVLTPPTPTATPSPTATATPAPTVAPVTGGLLVNPSFEEGARGWYIESGGAVVTAGARGGTRALRLDPAGGYADQHLMLSPGGSYQLTVWGRLEHGVDLGYVGLVYRDAGWVRLRGLEPKRIEFTSQAYTARQLSFTVPAGVAHVSLFVWKTGGPSAFVVDDLLLVVAPAPEPPPPTPVAGCPRLLAPAYFYPTTGFWETMVAGGTALGMVVLNPDSGPGARHDWRYDAPLAAARAAGVRVVGYIPTSYGTRPAEEVTAAMDRYREWYGVTSFFLDEGDTGAESLPLYTTMTDYAHAMGGVTVINFGYHPHPSFMSITDYAVVFEDDVQDFLEYSPPDWMRELPAKRFINLVYNVPADRVDDVIRVARERNLGWMWITDDRNDQTGSPYDTLPSYWSSLNERLAGSCAAS